MRVDAKTASGAVEGKQFRAWRRGSWEAVYCLLAAFSEGLSS